MLTKASANIGHPSASVIKTLVICTGVANEVATRAPPKILISQRDKLSAYPIRIFLEFGG
jgi:hypothetical protein